MDLEQLDSIARRELAENGLHGWSFGLSKARRRLGVCMYRQKRIEVAEYYARHSPEESVLDTLRHEIAHALAGPAAKHGPKWKAIAVRLGATPRSCESTGLAVVEPGDWRATCPGCERTVHLYRRPRSLTGYRCKCPARSPLTFEYVGEPARMPAVPLTAPDSARWEAACPGCGAVHLRVRRPQTPGDKGNNGRDLRLAPGSVAPHLPHDTRQMPPDLAEIAAAWPTLPEAVRAGILAMVRAASRRK